MAKPQEDHQKARRRRKNRESLLETLESIVVAFVLAFIFRAFIVEAFVIPTGSMAPTLYGEHAEFGCSDCGYKFAVGVENSTLNGEPLCPNCFLAQHVPERLRSYSGDRILVLKYLFDFSQPRRWDVIVFHNPNDPTQNYIKRLVALPGETIEMVDGNVTIDGQIAHKTDRAQEALWMLVHDTYWRPTRSDWEPRWLMDKDWRRQDKGFVLDKAPEKDKVAWLTYQHRGTSGRPENIMDFYGYNSAGSRYRTGAVAVTDLCLRGPVTLREAGSAVVVDLRAYRDRFRFELTAEGSDQPSRIWINDKLAAKSPHGVLPVGRSAEVLAADVDHKLMLLVNGRRVATETALGVTPEGDVMYTPTPLSASEREKYDNPPSDDPPPRAMAAAEVRIGARGGPVTLGYLRLDRDVCYLNESISRTRGDGMIPGHGIQGNPYTVGPDEFFVCGDNSPKSFDSRLWDLKDPAVPRKNLVGKAFFVYWPSAGSRLGIPIAPDPTGWRFVH
jgi:signal peptidase I